MPRIRLTLTSKAFGELLHLSQSCPDGPGLRLAWPFDLADVHRPHLERLLRARGLEDKIPLLEEGQVDLHLGYSIELTTVFPN